MDAPAELEMSLDEIIKNRSKASKPQKPTAATAAAAGAGRGRGGRHSTGRGGAAGQAAGRGSQRTTFTQGKGNYQPTPHQPGNTRSTTQTQHRGGYGNTASTMRIQTSFSNHDAQRRQVVFASDGERATRPAFPGQRTAQQVPRVSVHNRIQHTAQPQRQPHRQPQPQQQQQQLQLQQLRQQRQQQQLYEQQQFQRYQQYQQQRHLLQQQEQRRPAARTQVPGYRAQSPSRYDDDDDDDDEHYEMEPRRQAAAATVEAEDPMQCFKAMSCLLDEDTGDVTVKYRDTIIAVVGGSSGEMVLMPEGGERSKAIYECLQNMLLPIGFQISSSADKISSGQWHIIGASSMAKLKDGLLVPAKGTITTTRAAIIHAFLQNRLGGSSASAARPQAHQAATRASTLAAAELGILQPKGQPASQAQQQAQQHQQQQLLQQQMQQQFQQQLQQQQQQQALGSLAGQAAGAGNGGFVPMPMASSGIEQQFQQQLLQQQHMMTMISEGMMGHGKELPTRSTLRYTPY